MNRYLETIIFSLGDYSLKLYNLLILLVFLGVAAMIQSVVRRVIYGTNRVDASKKYSFYKLFQYVFWLIIVSIGFQILKLCKILLSTGLMTDFQRGFA